MYCISIFDGDRAACNARSGAETIAFDKVGRFATTSPPSSCVLFAAEPCSQLVLPRALCLSYSPMSRAASL